MVYDLTLEADNLSPHHDALILSPSHFLKHIQTLSNKRQTRQQFELSGHFLDIKAV
jgi:hypothetical protein